MISDKQLRANRLNAQKSAGPKTAAGKSTSSKNATVHGLCSVRPVIDGEDPAEYNDFRNDMIAQFEPVGPMETLLVDRIVHAAWRLRRIGTIEVQLYDFIRQPLEGDRRKFAKAKAAPPQNRFGSFNEAMQAWLRTEDGQLYAQNKWPTEPGYPSWTESFGDFKKPQSPQITPVSGGEGISTVIDQGESVRTAEIHNPADCRQEVQSLPLGRAVANDMQGGGLLCRLSRYETAIERSMFKNLRQLQTLQRQPAANYNSEPPDI
ncbi:MAG: hypothetical protein FVQ82_00780 [Planctomycetes bacterium]|nr:hypothetical protein [Planctomycetota bacterium]